MTARSVEALTALRVENMNKPGGDAKGDIVSDFEMAGAGDAQAEVAGIVSELAMDQGIGPQVLDKFHLHMGEGAFPGGHIEMFGADTDGEWCVIGHLEGRLQDKGGIFIHAQCFAIVTGAGGDEIHRRRAEEARDEDGFGPVVSIDRRPELLDIAPAEYQQSVAEGHGLDLVMGHIDAGNT